MLRRAALPTLLWALRCGRACHATALSGSQPTKVKFMSLEGGIGVGKSTMLSALKQIHADDPSVVFVDEQVDSWVETGVLQAFYDGSLNKAVFQQLALMSLAAGLFRALQSPNVRLIVSERSPHSNAIFAKVNLEGIEMAAYELTLQQLLDALPSRLERHVVLLEAPVPQLCERISTRGRESEKSGVDVEYMRLLADAHHAWYDEDAPTSQVTIDCSGPPEHVEALVGAHVAKLLCDQV